MNKGEIIRRHFSKLGAKGGKAGTGESKRRTGSENNLKKYWEDVKAGRREAPKGRGRPRKTETQLDDPHPEPKEQQAKPRTGRSAEEIIRSAREKAKAPKIKVGRNAPCPCGSGKKYKKCCGAAG